MIGILKWPSSRTRFFVFLMILERRRLSIWDKKNLWRSIIRPQQRSGTMRFAMVVLS